MRRATILLAISLICTPATADVPGPHDDLCTLEIQQQDGSSCEECSFAGAVPDSRPNTCDALAERGLYRRCSTGATYVSAIYCDREANFVEVGQGGACGCHVGGRGSGRGWLIAAWLGLCVRKIRRGRSRTPARCRSGPPSS